MTTYNGQDYVEEQIDSILNQTYRQLHLTISDDSSSDNTLNILKRYQAKFTNITIMTNQKRIGYVKNFEQLLNHIQGEYFALSDQDDIWDRDKIEKMMNSMVAHEKSNPNVPIMVHSDLRMIDKDGKELNLSYSKFRNYHFKSSKDIATLVSRGGVMGNTILMNNFLRKLVLPFDKNVVHHDYWIALVNELKGHRISLKEALVSYRIHDKNTSNKIDLFNKKRSKQTHQALPYRDNNRYEILKGVIKRYAISNEDKRSIVIFLRYLRAQNGWLQHYPKMLKEGFFSGSNHYKYLVRFAKASIRVNYHRKMDAL
ncbi:glycosyltransferase family 2 protein [Sulfuricurvum sp.]|uniref:glycosyltransferase family 2 protein n=1 Tax=Sulfuricurvum sp. TaxID=2025608 RepID=UPI002614B256|nr:glycosyltransferase family 2 protein [Sulfuricurvum sp.]MDD2781606.1 glycosyltransferase family 2 protein [Sulfuricurvum sp.]